MLSGLIYWGYGIRVATMKKTTSIRFRVTTKQKRHIETLARLYADGNMSKLLLLCVPSAKTIPTWKPGLAEK